MPIIDPPLLSVDQGFACKIWIAAQIEKHYLGGKYYVWFCQSLNPIDNGDSSNPLQLYLTVDRAVKTGDDAHPKIKDLRINLLWAIKTLIRPTDHRLARQLTVAVVKGSLKLLKPQIWRLDLTKVDRSRWRLDRSKPGWDEQYVTDLQEFEFQVIVP